MRQIDYIHLDTVTSTNTWAKERAAILPRDRLTCIFASTQTAGRGRFNRSWLSARGNNIYATLCFCLPAPCPFLGNLGQILSLACVQVISQKSVFLQIKWPNDLLIHGKKVAGILCETVPFEDRISVILGVGINVDLSADQLSTLDQPATSLQQEGEHEWTREELLEPIVKQFTRDLDLLKEKGFAPFLSEYVSHLTLKNNVLIHRDGERTLMGHYESIDEQGRFLLRLEDGKIVTLTSGELILKQPEKSVFDGVGGH